MADKTISALTAASTPLAGTEVLPIVQSSTTKKVATDDLTVKNIRSNATTGILQVAGPAAAATRIMTVPDANFTAARTDAANSFTGDQTLATGNLVIGTAGKGIDFSANVNAAGMTSELLDDYEEGSWTPAWGVASGSITANSNTSGRYRRVGDMVTVWCYISFQSQSGASGNVWVTGLPFTSGDGFGQSSGQSGGGTVYAPALWNNANFPQTVSIPNNNTRVNLNRPILSGVGAGAYGVTSVTFADVYQDVNYSQTVFVAHYRAA